MEKPNNKSTGRRYDLEYKRYHSKPKQRKARSQRNKANRKMGTYGNHDGLDVAHKDNNTNHNGKKNLVLQDPSENRSFERTATSKRK